MKVAARFSRSLLRRHLWVVVDVAVGGGELAVWYCLQSPEQEETGLSAHRGGKVSGGVAGESSSESR
jgi:hypothetical protein